MSSIRLLKPYFIENKWNIALGLFSLMLVDFLQLLIPRVIKWAVDDLTDFTAEVPDLFAYAAYIMVLALLIAIFRYVWRRYLIGLSRRVEEGLRNRLFFHVQSLSPAYFDRTRTGDIMAHATNDLNHIRMATGMGMVALTDATVLGTAAIGFMLYINVSLTLFALIPAPLIVLSTRFFTKRMHRYYGDVQASFSDLTEVTRERFAGIRIIKAYGREAAAAGAMREASRDYIEKNIRLVRISGSFFPLMVFFTNLSMALILFLGGRQAITAVITPGDFVAFISYLGLITWPMMALGWLTNLIQRGRASLDRINRILETVPAIADSPDARPARPPEEAIAFENVTFVYPAEDAAGRRDAALSSLDLRAPKGTTIGIVGPPGAGKTSLVSLALRLYDPTEGRVTLDGIDLRDLRLDDLRSMVAYVPQEPFMFAGTIRENIAFGADAPEERIRQALAQASLTETVAGLPNGLETLVGERGVMLSGGQKQRIALARAFLTDAPILILDDPISQVDMATGKAIIAGISEASRRRTTFIVSHRLSALRHADDIIVMREGRVAERGNHGQLMERDGYYARTFRLQEVEEAMHV